ncbi:MAG TPA: hypothetical protein VHE34_18970 [Puia sp.]|uniref:hypothetical protein n=1 Tax=Puia sp. TaxID=2045100 RepID=UPI002CA8598F|nr:hypothetical protein [Puia sp.]HVU97323.1 hypothetical protein [Puia sp.]
MEPKVLDTVMNELLEEQKRTNELLEQEAAQQQEVAKKVDGFDDKLGKVRLVVPAIDTQPIAGLMEKHFEKVIEVLEAQPKNVVYQRRYLLFPEDNSGYYYKIIFGRLIPWVIIIIIFAYLLNLGNTYLKKQSEIANRRYYYETFSDAWDRLDSTIGPAGRKKMDEALKAAVRNQELKSEH